MIGPGSYLMAVPPFEFCIPIVGTKVAAGPEWLHEIKYDGYRLRVERNGDRERLITHGSYDWTKRYLPRAALSSGMLLQRTPDCRLAAFVLPRQLRHRLADKNGTRAGDFSPWLP